MLYHYGVSYLDSNGFVTSYGYIETLTQYKSGDIITAWNGQKIRIDY